ncbi:M4 family metallopeptidase [Staphylococcus chromogenes]|uniref:M4 family metallopeptidase n=1 Tax=Staphylococcus chromogenes TaxID=46126 RepID=UPI002DB71874|nr:M4 family metallopeptidase [Staphylococcus chromogenes]MEB7451021.1 M4 family metallopeptidase [Staphylococcus chromogenes]
MYQKLGICALSLSLLGTVYTPNAGAESVAPTDQITVHSKSDVMKALKQIAPDKGIKNYNKYYSIEKEQKDDMGYTHYTLYPKVKNHIATDREVKVHVNPQGKVVMVNGEFKAPEVKPKNDVALSKEDALNNAFKAVKMTRNEAKNGKDQVVKSNKVIINGDENKYVYEVELTTIDPKPTHWKVQIDAKTGNVVDKQDLIQHAAEKGTGVGVRNDHKQININSTQGGYTLEDLTRNGVLFAYSYNQYRDTANLITSRTRTFDANDQKAGVDANYYAGKVYDYYKNVHNRDSYDDKGSPIQSITHVNTFHGEDNSTNAAWLGDKMIYGDGDGREMHSLAAADDIIAHEITHGVTQETAGLVYQDQPGALNESFSDVFAYFIDPEDTLLGEDAYIHPSPNKAFRSFSEPEKFGQPAHMRDYKRVGYDNGGVHINSGIPNKAAYLTTEKLGKEKAEKIYYRALSQYLTSTSRFVDAKHALEQSAEDLYGASAKQKVTEAWNEVGL